MDAEYSPLESSHVRIAVAPSTPNHTPSQTPQTTPRKRLKIAFSGAENLAAQTPYVASVKLAVRNRSRSQRVAI